MNVYKIADADTVIAESEADAWEPLYPRIRLTLTRWDVSGNPIEAIRPDGSRISGRFAVKAELDRLRAEPVLRQSLPAERETSA